MLLLSTTATFLVLPRFEYIARKYYIYSPTAEVGEQQPSKSLRSPRRPYFFSWEVCLPRSGCTHSTKDSSGLVSKAVVFDGQGSTIRPVKVSMTCIVCAGSTPDQRQGRLHARRPAYHSRCSSSGACVLVATHSKLACWKRFPTVHASALRVHFHELCILQRGKSQDFCLGCPPGTPSALHGCAV